jgi:hypothetical protein
MAELLAFVIKTRNVKDLIGAVCLWLMPIILATQEAEIRRIMVHS